MNRARLNRINRKPVLIRSPEDYTSEDRLQFLAELKCWAEMNNYKTGWPSVQYKERFGNWPAWGLRDNPAALNVSAETMAYIKERKKLWKKERKKVKEQQLAEAAMRPAPVDDWIELGECHV